MKIPNHVIRISTLVIAFAFMLISASSVDAQTKDEIQQLLNNAKIQLQQQNQLCAQLSDRVGALAGATISSSDALERAYAEQDAANRQRSSIEESMRSADQPTRDYDLQLSTYEQEYADLLSLEYENMQAYYSACDDFEAWSELSDFWEWSEEEAHNLWDNGCVDTEYNWNYYEQVSNQIEDNISKSVETMRAFNEYETKLEAARSKIEDCTNANEQAQQTIEQAQSQLAIADGVGVSNALHAVATAQAQLAAAQAEYAAAVAVRDQIQQEINHYIELLNNFDNNTSGTGGGGSGSIPGMPGQRWNETDIIMNSQSAH